MANEANKPFADALAKTYPAPEGISIFTAGPEAKKMLAFWSVKQTTTASVLAIGNTLFRVVLHQCPNCEQHLSAQAVKMSAKEREMMAALQAMLKTAKQVKPAGTPAPKQPKPAKKQAAPAPVEDASELSSEDMEELERLTSPGQGA